MSEPKYKKGAKIRTIAQFEESKCKWFVWTHMKDHMTKHRTVLENLQYATLKKFIENGWIYEAELKKEDEKNKRNADKPYIIGVDLAQEEEVLSPGMALRKIMSNIRPIQTRDGEQNGNQ